MRVNEEDSDIRWKEVGKLQDTEEKQGLRLSTEIFIAV